LIYIWGEKMEPIRILQVFTIMNRGGAETMIMNYYRKMERSKIQFDFLVHRQEEGAYDAEIENLGGRIYRMPPIHPKQFITYKQEIAKFLHQHKEYKIIHGNCSELGYFLYKEAKKQGVPTIICHAHNSKMSLDLKAPFRLYWKYACRKYITHMFSCSAAATEWFFGAKNESKAIVMNNAVDVNRFSFSSYKAKAMKEKLGLTDQFIIGHIGRFNVQKNHDFLIDIFYQIKKKCDRAVLILVGAGELETKILQKVEKLDLKDSVFFLGTRADINEIMQAFDVFLFPSLFEGLPVTMVEAQAAGLQCIISDTIPSEVKITDLIHFVSLNKSATYWADETLKYKEYYKRENQYQQIASNGYDIKANAKWLEEFYLRNQKHG